MQFRPYTPTDEVLCLAIFDSNTPRFFAPHERAEFATFLQNLPCPYFVLEDDEHIVGCGGVSEKNGVGIMAWGMVAQHQHRHGYGRQLLRDRIAWMKTHMPHLTEIHMNTSQHSVHFFEREGFRATRIIMNGFAPGLHQHDLVLRLQC